MRRIIYLSQAKADMTTEKAAAIVEKSRRKNEAQKLTGALVFKDGKFLQILEGPAEAVAARFQAIQRDARHHDLHVLYDSMINSRSYPDTPMQLLDLDALPDDAREALQALYDLEPAPPVRRLRTLRDLLPRFHAPLAA
ncbi:BLUF domain-containing protein [Phaeobacter sp. HF9A]|nr:BLUF domain-containing protein [Phaeobacter sp. HF9A]